MAEYPDYNAIEDYNSKGYDPSKFFKVVALTTDKVSGLPIVQESRDLSPTLRALAELYETYYQITGDPYQNRNNVEQALYRLMLEYDRYLG